MGKVHYVLCLKYLYSETMLLSHDSGQVKNLRMFLIRRLRLPVHVVRSPGVGLISTFTVACGIPSPMNSYNYHHKSTRSLQRHATVYNDYDRFIANGSDLKKAKLNVIRLPFLVIELDHVRYKLCRHVKSTLFLRPPCLLLLFFALNTCRCVHQGSI